MKQIKHLQIGNKKFTNKKYKRNKTAIDGDYDEDIQRRLL